MAQVLHNVESNPTPSERNGSSPKDHGTALSRALRAAPPAAARPNVDSHSLNHDTRALTPENADFSEPETDPDMNDNVSAASGLEQLKQENAELRSKLADLEQFVNETTERAQLMDQEHKEMEGLIEENSDIIRQLHQKIQDLESRPPVETPREEELLALHEELEDERRQLKEDEESLMQQMRQMEVQMSRERAEMARQRNELQRLHNEIKHELELASREAELRDRLQPLQRRHQEMACRKGSEPAREAAATVATNHVPKATPKPAQADEKGIFRRLFGQ